MKKYIKLFVFFLISILICLIFFNVLPKIQEKFNKPTEDYTLFQKEILLKELVENDKLTMLYFYPQINSVDIEADAFHDLMLSISQTFPGIIENKVYAIDSPAGREVLTYLNKTKSDSFAVLLDKNGYLLNIYEKPLNKNDIFKELTYSTNYAR